MYQLRHFVKTKEKPDKDNHGKNLVVQTPPGGGLKNVGAVFTAINRNEPLQTNKPSGGFSNVKAVMKDLSTPKPIPRKAVARSAQVGITPRMAAIKPSPGLGAMGKVIAEQRVVRQTPPGMGAIGKVIAEKRTPIKPGYNTTDPYQKIRNQQRMQQPYQNKFR